MSMLLTEAPTAAEPRPYRVTVDEFDRMVEAGAFHPEARVELLNGELIEMSPIGPPHAFVVTELGTHLGRRLDQHVEGRAVVRIQCPLRCGDMSQPQPDIAVIRGPSRRYMHRHPTAADALLVVEVADSSLRYDQDRKLPVYGSLDVPEVWVVDIPHQRIHVYTGPRDGGYGAVSIRTAKDVLVPTAFPDVKIAVDELLVTPRR